MEGKIRFTARSFVFISQMEMVILNFYDIVTFKNTFLVCCYSASHTSLCFMTFVELPKRVFFRSLRVKNKSRDDTKSLTNNGHPVELGFVIERLHNFNYNAGFKDEWQKSPKRVI